MAHSRARKNPAGRDLATGIDTATPVEAIRSHANHYQKTDLDCPGVSRDVAHINRQWYPHPADAHDHMPIQTLPVIKKMLVDLLR